MLYENYSRMMESLIEMRKEVRNELFEKTNIGVFDDWERIEEHEALEDFISSINVSVEKLAEVYHQQHK